MAGFTDYLENKVLIHVFGGTAYTAPSTLYVGLFTAAPSDTGGGTECSGGSYARKSMPDMTVSGTSPTTATNGAAVEFVTATGAWGTVTHCGVFDAATSGNLLGWAALTASKTVASGDVFRFDAGDLDITLA
jgi:hypothetical protein|tara:strand:+ start:5760 stop:6155 length:396 start_codon:yes stop_codon:yes gene_type:complete